MRHSVILKKASLAGAFFVSLLCVDQAQAFCPQRLDLAQIAVRQVVDGDTVRLVDGRSIRLIGINTPELGRKGRSDEPYAVQARRRLQALVDASDGRVGLLYGKQRKDRYGRTLAHLYDRQGRNLEAQLLGEGLGFMVVVAPNSALVSCHVQAERQARSQRLGLWRSAQVKSAGQLSGGGFALLGGRITGVQRNRGGLWIDLDGGRVLRVAPEMLDEFDVHALQKLKGRRVEARGWVIDRQSRGGLKSGQARWMLPLTHSAMLEVLP
ncbi:thermonuclease family protein [Pseudomonas sp. Z8(2022)]|uniref:thermonuclease family protein n=1 Tax=Pseudomonas sp. Z8(2022) TaxID=2962597 RepID=UPI0021F3CA41|nr:thermonuclease family protein [Pseudomonas sp. Z8(2022)]UYP30037.1 thermonuclease family protein [Pseudomonas sp. Z8(2022)]